jgi:predicted phosphodiesterase
MFRAIVFVTAATLGGCACPSDPPDISPDEDEGSDGGRLDAGTPDAGGPVVGFIAVGDTGHGDAAQIQVATAMTTWCAAHRCDFVVLLGDNFYPSGVSSITDSQWQTSFELIYAGLNIPFYAALGNHDYGNNGLGTDFGKAQNQVAYAQQSSKWKMPSNRYHFTHGNVEILVADTNLSMFGLDAEVRTDFQTWTAASTARWKFAMAHHPYLSNGPHGNAGTYEGIPTLGNAVKTFIEGYVCGKVDVYMSGHDHSRQWLQPTCNGTELIVSGAGSGVSSVTARNAAYFSKATGGFVYFAVEQNTLTGTFVDNNGQAEFTRTLTK